MRTDALEIDRFHRSIRGEASREMVRRRLAALWPETRGLDILGYGFAAPWLDDFKDARRAVAYMPASQGAVAWPARRPCRTALGDEARLPFAEALFDRVLLVHALEEAGDLRKLLRELWRVMAPEGRMAIVVPNRAGLWARAESTPFGHGRPFSRTQISRLLTDSLLEPTAWSRALYAPPWRWACQPKAADLFEQAGDTLMAPVGGLILVEAVKHVGAVRPGGTPVRARVKSLEGAAKPALSGHTKTRSDKKGAP